MNLEKKDYTLSLVNDVKGLKIGLPKEYIGAEIVECDVDELDITNKEAVLNFGEFDIIFNCAGFVKGAEKRESVDFFSLYAELTKS